MEYQKEHKSWQEAITNSLSRNKDQNKDKYLGSTPNDLELSFKEKVFLFQTRASVFSTLMIGDHIPKYSYIHALEQLKTILYEIESSSKDILE